MWVNKKFPKREFKGRYVYLKSERVFELHDGKRTITFESWQMAKNNGWSKN